MMTEPASRRLAVVACVAVAALFATTAQAARGGRLQIHSRTMQLGGKLSLTVDTAIPEGGSGQSGFQLEVSPHFGVFVADGFELMFTTAIVVPFGDMYDNAPKNIGFFFGLRYVFDLGGPVLPYLGIAFGPDFVVPSRGSTQTFFGFNLPMGILIALNRHVAINIGVAPAFAFGIGDVRGTMIRIPMGFLGVDAFF
jgi:hypothetical protein